MKFRHGLIVGLGVGYYLGAKAGQQRYEQIDRVLDKVRTAPGYADARGRVVEYYDAGRDLALSRLDEATNGAASSILDLRADDDNAAFDFDDDLTTVDESYGDAESDGPTA